MDCLKNNKALILKEWQLPVQDAINRGYKEIVAVMPRRSGKTLTAFNCLMDKAFKDKGHYALVTQNIYSYLHEAIGIDNTFTELENGSTVERVTDKNLANLSFKRYAMIIFDEYGLIKHMPNVKIDCTIYMGTPCGKNHFYEKYMECKDDDDCYSYLITIDDTDNQELLDDPLLMFTKELIDQEFYCKWESE